MEKSIKVEYTQDEINTLVSLMDAGVKATGLPSVKGAAHLFAKLEAAVAEVNKAAAGAVPEEQKEAA